MRYYHGLIDTQLLSTNISYDKLQNVVIITILPYDPFGKNRMVYTIQNQCIEDTAIPYDDGAKKIFLYTKGIEGSPSQELRDMLKYIEQTTDDNVTNQSIDVIHQFVNKVKHKKEVGISYMKSWEHDKMVRDEGYALGIKQGIEALINTCQEFSISREDTLSKLVKNFSLKQEEASAYIEEYWK